ncbi:hypothetical protein [Noviherbaspirillum sp. Root189]|nr:hypothetical protein [Noviherbaspirillum sp. Root189]
MQRFSTRASADRDKYRSFTDTAYCAVFIGVSIACIYSVYDRFVWF